MSISQETLVQDSLRDRMNERQQEFIKRQISAILGWCNAFLQARNMKAVNIEEDFSDGVLLINLLEVEAFPDLPSP